MLLSSHREHGHGDYTLVEMPSLQRRLRTSVRAFFVQTAEDVLAAASGKHRGRKGKQVPLRLVSTAPSFVKKDVKDRWRLGQTK